MASPGRRGSWSLPEAAHPDLEPAAGRGDSTEVELPAGGGGSTEVERAGAVTRAGRGMRRRSTRRPSRAKAAVQASDTAAMLASAWWWKAPAAANCVGPYE